MKIECPTCSTGWISEREQAQGHGSCGFCRVKAQLEQDQKQKENAFHRANQRAMK